MSEEQNTSGGRVRLEPDEIRDIEDLDELREAYQQKGATVETVEEAYTRARKDWWEQVREDDFDPVDELPGDSVTLTLQHNGEQHETTFHIHGIYKQKFMDDAVREFIHDEVERFAAAGDHIHLQEELEDRLYPGGDAPEAVTELHDFEALEDELDEEHGNPSRLRMVIGGGYMKLKTMKDAPDIIRDVSDAAKEAGKNPETIADTQNASIASELPYNLEQAHGEQVLADIVEQVDEYEEEISRLKKKSASTWNPFTKASCKVRAWVLNKKKWLPQSAVAVGTDLEYRRSELMAEEALPALYDEDVDDVRLILGSLHYPSTIQYIESLEADDLTMYAPGA